MRKGQGMIVAVLLFSFVTLFSALSLKEAIFSLFETRKIWGSLQGKLLCQSGIVLARKLLERGTIPSSPLETSPFERGQLLLSFSLNETRTKVKVEAVGQVEGRRFSQLEFFSFPEGIGKEALCLFFCDPKTGKPFPPFLFPLGEGFIRARLVSVVGEKTKFSPSPSFLGVAKESLLGVGEGGEFFSWERPNKKGIFAFDGWWRVPNLPGPFSLLFPFAPLKEERVEDESGVFKRVSVLPRFPRQYFLDEEKGVFFFSGHEAGKAVKISGWTKGFRCYGPFYANASLLLSGNSLFALLTGRGDKVTVTGKVFLQEGGKSEFVLPEKTIGDLSGAKLQDLLEEGTSPRSLPKPCWASWRESVDSEFGGEGKVLPPLSLLDLSQVGEERKFFFEGDGVLTGKLEGGKGWVVVFCQGTLTIWGSLFVEGGSFLALVAKEIIWRPKSSPSFLFGLLWATEGSFRVEVSENPSEPMELVFVGSLNVNGFPKVEEGGKWGVEFFYAPTPFPSFLVQPIGGGEQP